ncbi:MAG: restriction endonuclease subunit S [Firmicutes bacterium]|nr:restriction endonuclease subunit S [Bacillota bacterium]
MKAAELRKSILQAAVQGKLVPQDIHDEPASVLLERIRAEKDRLMKEGKIKKENPLPPITEDEIPYDLPEGWVWCRLGDIVIQNIGGGTPSKQNSAYWNGNIPWASVKDLTGPILDKTRDYITELGLEESSSNLIPANSIIVCTRMGLGKISINTIPVAINQDLRALIISRMDIDLRYDILSHTIKL